MKEWFDELESRERLLVISGAVALVIFLVYVLVLQPLRSSYHDLKDNVSVQRETAQWMQQGAHQVQQLRRAGGATSKGLGGRSLLAVADSTARAGGLGPFLKRVEPEGKNGVRVWLEGASFDDLVKWLGILGTSHGVDVDNASLERSESAGRVNARLTLQAVTP